MGERGQVKFSVLQSGERGRVIRCVFSKEQGAGFTLRVLEGEKGTYCYFACFIRKRGRVLFCMFYRRKGTGSI